MTHTATQQTIIKIMGSIGENIECDQIVNKLVEQNIISKDDVARINRLEDKNKFCELTVIIMEKGPELHQLALKVLQTLTAPNQQTTARTDQAIAQAAGSSAVSSPMRERRILTNAEVSEDWALKNFLVELSQDIGSEEFEAMKDIMQGESGFKSAVLEKIDRPMKFFRQMMNTGRLNAYNLHFLQALIRRTGRKDLNDKVRHFCLENNKKPIHFFVPNEEPENGYKYVKFHIEGSIEKLSHQERERLRTEVSTILCVPLMFVFIRGIEPTDSLLFTFMVPDEDVSSFIHIYVSDSSSFVHLSLHIQVQDNQLSLSEIPLPGEKEESSMLYQLKHLLEREQSLQEQLEERDEKLVDLQAELDSQSGETTVDQFLRDEHPDIEQLHKQVEFYKTVNYRLLEVMKTMQPKNSMHEKDRLSLKLASATSLYQNLHNQAIQQNGCINKDLLNKLLDARALIESIIHEQRLRHMQGIIDILNQKVEEVGEMNGFLRMSGSSGFLQDILAVQAHSRNLAIQQQEQHGLEVNGIIGVQVLQRLIPGPTEVSLKPEYQDTLAAMTNDLSVKDRNKLKTFLCLSEEEKNVLKENPEKLLELALLREIKQGSREPFEMILGRTLAKIQKQLLVSKYFPNFLELPKLIRRSSEKKRKPKRGGRSETPQRYRTDSEQSH